MTTHHSGSSMLVSRLLLLILFRVWCLTSMSWKKVSLQSWRLASTANAQATDSKPKHIPFNCTRLFTPAKNGKFTSNIQMHSISLSWLCSMVLACQSCSQWQHSLYPIKDLLSECKLLSTWSSLQPWMMPWVSQYFQSWSLLHFACFSMLSGSLTIVKSLTMYGFTKTKLLIIWNPVISSISKLTKHHHCFLQPAFVPWSSLFNVFSLRRLWRD